MKMSQQVHPKVEQAVKEINNLFWDEFQHKTESFPDTDYGSSHKHTVALSSIISIIGSYLLGFSCDSRKEITELVVDNIRKIERLIRDQEVED